MVCDLICVCIDQFEIFGWYGIDQLYIVFGGEECVVLLVYQLCCYFEDCGYVVMCVDGQCCLDVCWQIYVMRGVGFCCCLIVVVCYFFIFVYFGIWFFYCC